MTDDRDPFVAQALRDLPVPEHGPGFWERLDARLRAEQVPGGPGAGSAVPDGRVATSDLPVIPLLPPEDAVPSPARRRFLAAAAVVAVLALATGVAVRGGDGGGTGELAATTTSAVTAASGDGGSEVPVTHTLPAVAPPPSAPAGAPSPEAAVLEWVDALGVGDTDRATTLVGPLSRRYIESLGGDVEGFMVESQEGYGSWRGVSERTTTEVDIPGAGVVVVLHGTGYDGQRIEAVPTVESQPGSWVVEHLAFDPETGGRPEIVTPAPDPGLGTWTGQRPDVVLEAVSQGRVRFWFALDDLAPVPDDDGVYDPPGDLPTGTHLLVVAVVGDGIFGALAGTFVVE